ncbi:MAG: hypothetical protein GWO20_01055 [Candidatus Korarchaeota archaeon]|nr:hypothetical protein [Candidatus Korarchaeota archaeon]NIU82880.1 hypothetical protein [Candidatus Thorarchaeota archaeon]NIW12574.1 hypothetical protein [Candidatus Thorarchaeota archaeon]NIW50794.1 hypothetical protein [Candidatus Korarchaeota archaeon]
MSKTTIGVSEKTRDRLKHLKMKFGFKSLDELLQEMIQVMEILQFERMADKVRHRMDKKRISLDELCEAGRRVRKEVFESWSSE